MPLPKPKSGEKDDDFIGRCMSDAKMVSEYPDESQRAAICYNQLNAGKIKQILIKKWQS